MANPRVDTRAPSSPAAFDDDPKLAEIVRRLVAALHPERIYLFGSRARGDHREDSDYDVLVLVDTLPEYIHALEVTGRGALWGLAVSTDIVVVTPDYFDRRTRVVASLPGTVAREGQLLYAA